MARSLGGVALTDGTGTQGQVLWTDRDQAHGLQQAEQYTLGGVLVLPSRALVGGRRITLATAGAAWLTRAQVDAVRALDTPGATVTLVYDDETVFVAFRHVEPPAWQFTELWPGAGWFEGEIRLISVGG